MRLAIAAAISLALNAVLLVIAVRMGAFDIAHPREVRAVTLAPLSAAQWSANRALTGAARPPTPSAPPPVAAQPAPAPPPPPPEPPRASGQVVDVAPSKDSTPPRSSRFLSEHDSTVEKETVSRFAGTKHFENTLPAPSDGAKKRPQADAGEGGVAKESKEGKQEPEAKGTGAEQLGVPRQPAQDRLAMVERPGGTRPGDVKVAPKEERERVSGQGETLQVPGTPGASVPGQRKAGDPRLLPSMDSLARIAGGPSNDFLRDVEEGETTALNTRAFKYATFWNRFKGAISEQWRPAIVYNSRDPDGRLFGSQDRETRLEVVLDGESGALKSIRVVGQSGLDFLDREAVRAVQTAAPFPNPPRALADERGEIRFPFGMVVVLNHLSGLHPIYSPGPSQRPFPE